MAEVAIFTIINSLPPPSLPSHQSNQKLPLKCQNASAVNANNLSSIFNKKQKITASLNKSVSLLLMKSVNELLICTSRQLMMIMQMNTLLSPFGMK